MEKGNPAGPTFRLRLVQSARHLVRVAAGGAVTPTRLGRRAAAIEITLCGRTVTAPDEGNIGCVPSAVALLRTVFEDHQVDLEHQSCLFFNGCTIGTCTAQYDFSVTHRGGAVVLSGFTFPAFHAMGSVELPVGSYAREILNFARRVWAQPEPPGLAPWARTLHQDQRRQLAQLLALTEGFVRSGCRDLPAWCRRFAEVHGHRKRPLELQVLTVEQEGDLPSWAPDEEPQPWVVECRVAFGPISVQDLVPLRVNGGDLVLGRALGFGPRGVTLEVLGAGSGGLGRGDWLRGIQLFYP